MNLLEGTALRIEPNYLDTPLRKHGRPATGYTSDRVLHSIDALQRAKFRALGFREEQQDQAIKLCRRGFTVQAAARITLAGGQQSLVGGRSPK